MTTIGIIGTGSMARELGKGWLKAGYIVVFGSRNPDSAGADLGIADAEVRGHAEAIEGADVVVLAVPFSEAAPTAREHRDRLSGKVIIDISNPFDKLANNERAGAEYTADALGGSTGLVAAFKDNFAATINAPGAADGRRPDVKLAGDDEEAKAAVAALAADLDHRVIDCGPLHNARFIDGMVSLMLILDEKYCGFTMKTGWRFFGLGFE